MVDYSAFADKVINKLSNIGKKLKFVMQDSSPDQDWKPPSKPPKEVMVNSLVLPVSSAHELGLGTVSYDEIKRGSVLLICAPVPGSDLSEFDYFINENKHYSIDRIEKLSPTGTVLIYYVWGKV